MRKRNISKAVAAAGLAAATLVSGLSFGSAASATPNSSTVDSTANVGEWSAPFKMVFEDTVKHVWYPVGWNSSLSYAKTSAHYTFAEADAAAPESWTYNSVTGQIRFVSDNTQCMSTSTADRILRYFDNCTATSLDQKYDWINGENGMELKSRSAVGYSITSMGSYGSVDWGNRTGQTPWILHPGTGFQSGALSSVLVDSVNRANRSAILSGRGTVGATIDVNGQTTTVASDGSWKFTVTGLKLETQELVVKQLVDGVEKDNKTVTADLSVAATTADIELKDDVTQKAVVSGTATPGANILAHDAKGKQIGGGYVGSSGDYSFDIDAPNAGGATTISVVQQFGNEEVNPISRPVAYGAAPTIENPADGAEHDGGTVRLEGTGEPNANLIVRADGAPSPIGTGKVSSSGSFDITTTVPLDDAKHTLTVTQTGKGNNVTTDDVTVNSTPKHVDVTVTSPKNGDRYEPNKPLRFTGVGTPGAQIELDPNNGLAKYYADVNDKGDWSIDRPMGTGPYTFSVIQSINGTEHSRVDGITVTAKSTDPIVREFKVTSPERYSFHQDKNVTFTGEGTPGDTIRLHVTNFASQDVTTTVKNDGKWSVARYLGAGAYTFDITQERPGGGENGAERGFELNQTADKNLPFEILSPEGGSYHQGKVVTFTGNGSAGSTIDMTTTNFAGAPASTKVKSDGTWSIVRYMGQGAYTFDVTQTNPAGTVTDTVRDYRINQPKDGVDKPFHVDGPATDSTFNANTNVTFHGTGAIGAAIEVKPTNGLTPVHTVVDGNGEWSVNKFLGNGSYTFEVTMTPKTGTPETSAPISLTPTK